MSNLILVVFYILIGYILKNITLPFKDLAMKLNKFVIYVSLPAMIFLQIPQLKFSEDTMIPVVVSWGVIIVSAFLVFFISRFMNFSKEVTGSLMFVTVLTNSSFLGIPIVGAFMGEGSYPYILVYDQLGTFLALATYGTIIGAYYSSDGQISLKIISLKVLTFPPFVSLVIALSLSGIVWNETIKNVLEILSATIVPFALISVGLQLYFKLPKDDMKPFSISLFIQLIIAPLIAIGICYIFGWTGFIAQISILEAGMAPMITAATMASMLGLAPRLSNAIVGYGILFSFMTSWILFNLIV
jgi:predicted permease